MAYEWSSGHQRGQRYAEESLEQRRGINVDLQTNPFGAFERVLDGLDGFFAVVGAFAFNDDVITELLIDPGEGGGIGSQYLGVGILQLLANRLQ